MAGRLTLNTAGIKSPLDVEQAQDATDRPAAAATAKQPQRRRAARAQHRPPRSPRATQTRSPAADATRTLTSAPFYGGGRPLQTSIALDTACAAQLAQLARAASVSVNALAVAVLHAGLPTETQTARAAIVDERVRRAGEPSAVRVERNLRLPDELRARVDELTGCVRERVARATRADLVNAALRRGLPADAQAAAHLVAEHAQRRERAAAA